MTKSKHTEPNNDFHFEGISKPNATMIPNEVLDYLMPRLTEGELKVVLYICRRTFGFQKDADAISINQMIKGLKTADGKVLDEGTGLGKATVIRATTSLVEKGVIIVEKRKDEKGENEINVYRLRLKDDAVSTSKGVVSKKDYGSLNLRPTKESITKERYISFERENPKNGKKAYSHTEQGAIRNPVKNTRESLEKPVAINQIVQDRLHQLQTMPTAPPQNGTDHTSRNKPQGNWKKAPLFIQAMIEDWFSLELNDQAKKSSITRTHRIYLTWKQKYPDATHEQLEDAFRDRMHEARTKAKHKTPRVKTTDGRFNRMPYFFSCLEDVCGIKQPEQPD
jgi:hypothetical protein